MQIIINHWSVKDKIIHIFHHHLKSIKKRPKNRSRIILREMNFDIKCLIFIIIRIFNNYYKILNSKPFTKMRKNLSIKIDDDDDKREIPSPKKTRRGDIVIQHAPSTTATASHRYFQQ